MSADRSTAVLAHGDRRAGHPLGSGIYLAVTLAGALWCGQRWCTRADPFEVYSVVASRLSPLRRDPDGRIAVGNPFDHLPSLPVRPGTVAVLAMLLGSTAFDSFSANPQWRNFVAARGLPADGAVGDDAGDGRLHVHRAVSTVWRVKDRLLTVV